MIVIYEPVLRVSKFMHDGFAIKNSLQMCEYSCFKLYWYVMLSIGITTRFNFTHFVKEIAFKIV